MNRFVKKIIEFLLKRTEHLDKSINKNANPNDPMQKKMKALLEKREQMKAAVGQADKGENAQARSTTMSSIISQSLEAKKSAMTPAKKSNNAKRTPASKRRGR
jgi:hypothetical protein